MSRNLAEPQIHPTAEVSDDADIGYGTMIWHHSQVREGAKIGRNCILGKSVYIDFNVTVGDNCKIQNGVSIYHPAIIGDGVFLGPGVFITNDKLPRAVNPDMSLKGSDDWEVLAVSIGNGATVGAGSVILPGIVVGDWAMVGAGSIVTRDIPIHGLAMGNPARIFGKACYCGAKMIKRNGSRYRCSACNTIITIKET